MSRDIENMISNVADGSLDSAEQSFNAAISEKIASALENMRVSVASRLVGTNEEVELGEAISDESHRDKIRELSNKIDSIVSSGGRVGLNDPLHVQMQALRRSHKRAKGIATAVKKLTKE